MAENGPAKKSDNAHPSLRETILRTISACVIGALVAIVIPSLFGEEFATRKAARVVAPLVGAFYKPDVRNDDITVVLVDEKAVEDNQESWPPSYNFYAKIVDDVARYRPRAIFVDLIFSSVRADANVKGLQTVLKNAQAEHIPVFLAAALNDKRELFVRDGLEGLATKVAVEYDPDELDHVVWTYPMVARDSKHARSAALAIYEDALHHRIEDPREELALTWGLYPVRDGIEWTVLNGNGRREAAHQDEKGEKGRYPDPASDVFKENYDLYCNENQQAAPLVIGAVWHALVARHGRPVCVFHHTLYAREMNYPSTAQSDRFQWLLKDKVVMIGSAYAYSNDVIVSPIQDRVPGVYLHAMALDNLITRGPDYTKAIELHELEADGPHARALLLLVIGGCCVLLLGLFKERVIEPMKERYRDMREPERIKIDETIVTTTRAPDSDQSDSADSEQRVTLHMHAEVVTQRRGRKPARFARFVARLAEGVFLTWLKALEVLLSVVMICVLLYLGHWVFNVPYLAIVHVTLFALVAEWFEWNKKLVDWYLGDKEKS
ncbi:CHASE2 domain-containing protein [Caballeronia sp. LZ035]|uniref:CHASE2 domain-containing protein n=1 Tax=Caballeronia sp. LZ035 TaxID=3038568 RepID=UPI002859D2BD|nr:CHASE2 domain-containing protein [Caballeronia sp. LZ035]MDR5761319.1 CHASE2 domain-containing protein [Caballeronia sp. LZ035]